MRKWLTIVATGVWTLGVAGVANAGHLVWEGTLVLDLGTLPPLVATGGGLSTVNGPTPGGLGHLNTLRLAGGISGTITVPLTDPETPTVVTLIGDNVTLGTGTISGISGGPPLGANTLPIGGSFRLCLLFQGCNSFLPIPVTIGGTRGLGIGGIITVNGLAKAGLKISIQFAPWTIGLASVKNTSTRMTPFAPTIMTTKTGQGFVHGRASLTSSTANDSGVIQLVTPARVVLTLAPPNSILGLVTTLTVHFIPEPGMLLLLGSGVAGLVLLGQYRMRK